MEPNIVLTCNYVLKNSLKVGVAPISTSFYDWRHEYLWRKWLPHQLFSEILIVHNCTRASECYIVLGWYYMLIYILPQPNFTDQIIECLHFKHKRVVQYKLSWRHQATVELGLLISILLWVKLTQFRHAHRAILQCISYKAELVLRKMEQKPWGFRSFRVHTRPMECHIALLPLNGTSVIRTPLIRILS